MRIFGIAGWSGSGKTSLIVGLIPELAALGHSVSTVKHAHHRFDIDTPGKDSFRHREAGAREVLVSAAHRWVLMHELRGEPEPELDSLLGKLAPVDLVLIEGFKRHRHPKLEVWRGGREDGPLWRRDPEVVAVATDLPADDPTLPDRLPVLDLNDARAIARFVAGAVGLSSSAADRVGPLEPLRR